MQKDTQNKNETLANRLIDILTRLNSGEKLTINMLAESYDAHPKTIRRDLVLKAVICLYRKRANIFI
jgi:predicted DNA-binding transcriptional regulator YafY